MRRKMAKKRFLLITLHNGACFDLILMNIVMSVMNDHQETKELRDMHVGSLIVRMTSHEREEEKKSFMDVGLDYYYQKPLTINAVRDLLEKIKGNAYVYQNYVV
ncbi:hypothetical protein MTR67_012655 [Solanum verrucosum]|uniref:Response regulatory domain-containing protein n=1 Tax=Solanum verrucosum TaxID=315347 RepID=A0AAF0TN27_SOLVR|nr:hypothetical protein MTR67_012655 [Solanum verrucosum]